ncbi:hypothetical protein B0H19DRAFT_1076366 [Mycena capillaripes]|nr:hypothetical protein B0H19DRAFT_1076366 [Mycena capillaripes]
MPPNNNNQDSICSSESDEKSAHPSSTVSKVPLDVEHISAEIAAELASTLIGHVLFLKNQVPFPVVQLYRIPGGKSTPKALKLRTDLLAAFDTLNSHLNTTFSALSTAFALAAAGSGDARPLVTRRAYLAILVGPSIGSAKTKVMFAVDGLVAKVWGERDDVEAEQEAEQEEGDEDSDDENDSDDDESGDSVDEDDEPHSGPSDADVDDPSDTDSSTRSDASSPPPSRSPSPSLSPCTSPMPAPRATSPPPSPSPQQTLRTATRLLAHTLATADHSMSAELAPSQTHILLRAPRRFKHPAWIPRQNASATLESALREFQEEAGDLPAPTQERRRARSRAVKVEGAWVTCRSPGVEVEFAADGDGDAAEEDEMIWWSWDGKIVGFADW